MQTFATVDDLAKLWSGFTTDKTERVQFVLDSVSASIAAKCDVETVDDAVLRLVTCQVALRMLAPMDGGTIGVQSESWTAAPYGGTVSYGGNYSGAFNLLPSEEILLGIGMEAGWAMPDLP